MPTNPPAGDSRLFALVCYLPSPLGTYLDRLRKSFPAQRGGRAHLTFLAPRPLSISPAAAQDAVAAALDGFDAFEVELTKVLRFPSTNVIYIGVGQGSQAASRLHHALNAGPLAHQELFDYRPHISLVFPDGGAELDAIERTLAAEWDDCSVPKRFQVNTLDFVQNTCGGAWEQLWHCHLGNSKGR
jgi:2'-5' RNA ligase